MTSSKSLLVNCYSDKSPTTIRTADETLFVSTTDTGNPSTSLHMLSLPNVFHVPDLSFNLLSINKLAETHYQTSFSSSTNTIQDPHTGQEIGTGIN